MLETERRLNYTAVKIAPIKSNVEGSVGFTEQRSRANYAAMIDAPTMLKSML